MKEDEGTTSDKVKSNFYQAGMQEGTFKFNPEFKVRGMPLCYYEALYEGIGDIYLCVWNTLCNFWAFSIDGIVNHVLDKHLAQSTKTDGDTK